MPLLLHFLSTLSAGDSRLPRLGLKVAEATIAYEAVIIS